MAIKTFRPVTHSLRHTRLVDFVELTESKPLKKLTSGKNKSGGRNNRGRQTVAGRGGGHKRRLRDIDFNRTTKDGVPARVHSIEYDPNRSSFIAQIWYKDGTKSYILAPQGLEIGKEVMSGPQAEPRIGNCLPLASIPQGLAVHSVELQPGKGAQVARAAGSQCIVAGRDGDWINVQLPSGEVRKFHPQCRASIGQLSNLDHMNQNYGKAGRRRWLGLKPKNRGVSKNPVDHPHGGGNDRGTEGGTPSDRHGNFSKGPKTRNPRKPSNTMIVRSRRGQSASQSA